MAVTVSQWADRLYAHLAERAGGPPDGVWAAPGRVNLIGEHTDYNDGFVLPFAIGRQTLAAVRRRGDGIVRCWSTRHRSSLVVPLAEVSPEDPPEGWAAYPVGVAWALAEAGLPVPGFDLLVDSDVPEGAGVSSSAALEAAVALAVADLCGAGLSRTSLALAGRRAENEIVGAPTGVMDQMAALCAEQGSALLLDCRSLEVRQVPLDLVGAGACLLVIDTRVKHEHRAGGYGDRRRSCQRAADALGVASLRDVDRPRLAAAAGWLDDETFRRARHVVTENDRVLRVADQLAAGNLRGVGALLDESHLSMRDDFEMSTDELDLAVREAAANGAWGARMTGGGFGGSAIALVPLDAVAAVVAAVRAAFTYRALREPHVFQVMPSRGASRVI